MSEFKSKELQNATEVQSSLTALPPRPQISTTEIIELIKYKLGQVSPLLVKQFDKGYLHFNDNSNANKMLIHILSNIKSIYTDYLYKDNNLDGKSIIIIEAIFKTLINSIEVIDNLGIQPNTMDLQALIAGNIFRNL